MKKTKHCVLLVICLLTIAQAVAQKETDSPLKFGKLSANETKMTVYDKDPDAAAVILGEKASLIYEMNREGNWDGTFKVHERLKIFKKEAYPSADIRVSYSSKQVLSDVQASCYNLEAGRWVETKLNPNDIVTEKISKTRHIKKFTIPRVREGSIIEYSYAIIDDQVNLFPNWAFQNNYPTLWSEYSVNIPVHFRIMPTIQGVQNQPIVVKEDTLIPHKEHFGASEVTWKNRMMRWAYKDVPAMKPEAMMSSIYNYKLRITLQGVGFYKPKSEKEQTKMDYKDLLADVWQQWGKRLLDDDDWGGFLQNKATDETVKALTDGLTLKKDKVLAIYKHIGMNYEETDYDQVYTTQSLKELLKKRKGTPTELNLLAINLLRRSGVESYPVLMSTRSNGRMDPQYMPMWETMDRVLVYLPALEEKDAFLVDVTAYPAPLGLLPFEDLNGDGFVIRYPNTWVPLKNTINTKKLFFNTLTLNDKGELAGTIAMTATGYEAVEGRHYFHKEGAEKYANKLLKDLLVDGKLETHSFENTDKLEEKYLKGSFKIKSSAFVTKTDSQMYVSPLLFWAEKENPFKNPDRKYDVDYGYARENSYVLHLTIPNGYKVESAPKNTKINFDKGNFTFTYATESAGNELKINVKWSIKKTIFVVEEYSFLRTTYETILNKMAEQIVLSKI
jgi:hypothetical protein